MVLRSTLHNQLTEFHDRWRGTAKQSLFGVDEGRKRRRKAGMARDILAVHENVDWETKEEIFL